MKPFLFYAVGAIVSGAAIAIAQTPAEQQQKMATARMQAEKDATEQMAAEQMKNARDWRATAMQLDAMVTDFKQQLEKAKKECPAPAEPPKP